MIIIFLYILNIYNIYKLSNSIFEELMDYLNATKYLCDTCANNVIVDPIKYYL